MSAPAIEIHGYVNCAFAWRVRWAAAEKGISYAWIPCDVPDPDPRAATHNPHEHSPLLHHDGLTLLESEVINTYLDESPAFAGTRALLPEDAGERAKLRWLATRLHGLDVHTEARRPLARKQTAPAFDALEAALGEGAIGEGHFLDGRSGSKHKGAHPSRDFLHGAQPGHVDMLIAPFVVHSAARGFVDSGTWPAVASYVSQLARRPSYGQSRPPWAPDDL